ncbi:Down syndrome cell adhesion molecule-like protein Dscam2 [Eumeta japonica]|uniref:Down syndrome cell adhesion molecule-like protein Dscam2 n=1 Tax=Eumeta variegata TaxID=151549 RepID=A0A4C1SDF1_EUMVA|nr:Down syndrome cell adhesion molecule-like protein Dscam2 [Eumeta japonica]
MTKRGPARPRATENAGAGSLGSAPRLSASPGDVAALQGADFCVPCAAAGHPAPAYTWYRESNGRLQPVELSTGHTWLWGGGAALCAARAGPDAAGAWLCKAHNAYGDATVQMRIDIRNQLTVQVVPNVQIADTGSMVRFNCTPSDPAASIRWLHDGVPVGGGSRELTVRGVARAHRGMYQCFARRAHDSAQAAAELRLGGFKRKNRIKHHQYPSAASPRHLSILAFCRRAPPSGARRPHLQAVRVPAGGARAAASGHSAAFAPQTIYFNHSRTVAHVTPNLAYPFTKFRAVPPVRAPSPTSSSDPERRSATPALPHIFCSKILRPSRSANRYIRCDHESLFTPDTAPELHYTFIEQALRAGGAVSLRCAASGAPAPRFDWLLDGQPVDQYLASHRFLVPHPDCCLDPDLRLKAILDIGHHTDSCIDPDPVSVPRGRKSGAANVPFGHSCRAPPHPRRYSVDEHTTAGGDVVSSLNVSAAAAADGGRYSCRAHNALGRAAHSARLNIYGTLTHTVRSTACYIRRGNNHEEDQNCPGMPSLDERDSRDRPTTITNYFAERGKGIHSRSIGKCTNERRVPFDKSFIGENDEQKTEIAFIDSFTSGILS